MLNATSSENAPPTNQPMNAPPPPVELNASGKAEIPPAKIQIIENEIAKFENPLMRRESSCAYPKLCSTFLSCSLAWAIFVILLEFFGLLQDVELTKNNGYSMQFTSSSS